MEQFVRPANESDLGAIERLLNDVHTELAPMRGGAIWLRSEARPAPPTETLRRDCTDSLGDDTAVHAAVAGVDQTVLAYAISRLRVLHDGSLVAHVEELVVDPAARSVGLGVSLLDDAAAWAGSVGAVGLESIALPGQRETKNFFEAAGMKARMLTVYRSLIDEAPLD
jgi:GNAT superfamily N-acetyltransferase